jgi:hypothetical protein
VLVRVLVVDEELEIYGGIPVIFLLVMLRVRFSVPTDLNP